MKVPFPSMLSTSILFFLLTVAGCSGGGSGSTATSVSASSSMLASCANRTPLLIEDFNNAGTCGFDEDVWDLIGVDTRFDPAAYRPNTGQENFLVPGDNGAPPIPPRGTCVANYYLQRGTNEQSPLRMTRFEPFKEIFYCWYEYFQAPFPLGGQKMSRLGSSSGSNSTVFLEYSYFNGSAAVTFFLADSNVGEQRATSSVALPLSSVENRWVEWCIYAKQGDPGVSNGRIALWIDGQNRADSDGIVTRTKDEDWDFFWIGGNNSWSAGFGVGGGQSVPFDGNRYIGGIEIYDTLCQ